MTTTSDEIHRARARSTINALRRGHLTRALDLNLGPVTKSSLNNSSISLSSSITSRTSAATALAESSDSTNGDHKFEKARENSIEVYDDNFARNSILTRSARMRKFKFYQYKPVHDGTPKSTNNGTIALNNSNSNNKTFDTPPGREKLMNPLKCHHSSPPSHSDFKSPSKTTFLMPRDDVLNGKVTLIAEPQSKELSELDERIGKLEKKIEDLKRENSNNDKLDEIFDLVNEKNDLLRRQMQLNILEQEKVLEKANKELTKELRSLLSIDDSKKTPGELERQKYLYEQSLALVNKRNELVYHLDVQEKAIEEDKVLKETLKTFISNHGIKNKSNKQDQTCCIQ